MKTKHWWMVAVVVTWCCWGWDMNQARAAEREDGDFFPPDAEAMVEVNDPIEPWNRFWFEFNDKLYFLVLKPVAQGYAAVIPEGGRIAVADFFHNLFVPVRVVNLALQGKVDKAAVEVGRFGINTVMGGLGFLDVAEIHFNLKRQDEDLGQTLGAYGLGDGFYLVWPVLGPSNLRDTVGMAGDFFLTPITYVPDDPWARFGLESYRRVNKISLWLGEYERMKEGSLDPYISMRHAYTANRIEKIKE